MEREKIFTGGTGVWQVLFCSCMFFDAKKTPGNGHASGVS